MLGRVCYLPAFPPGRRCVVEVEHILFVFAIHLCGCIFFFFFRYMFLKFLSKVSCPPGSAAAG